MLQSNFNLLLRPLANGRIGLHFLKKKQFVWLVTIDQVEITGIKVKKGFEEKKDDMNSSVAFPAEPSLWKVMFRKTN